MAEAEEILTFALHACEKLWGAEASRTLHVVLVLATLYQKRKNFSMAAKFYQRHVEASVRLLSHGYSGDPKTFFILAYVYHLQGHLNKAEVTYKRALKASLDS